MLRTTQISESERSQLQSLSSRRCDRAGLKQIAGHLGLLVLGGGACLAAKGSLWLAPVLLVQGAFLCFLFCPLHEASHRSAFRNRRLNDAVAQGCGALLLIAPTWFRHYHMAHHRWTQDPAQDPELETRKPESLLAWLWHVSGLPLWRSLLRTLLHLAAGRADFAYLPQRDRAKAVTEARVLLAVYAGVAVTAVGVGSWLPLLLWIGPLLVGQPLLRLFLLAEHGGCPLVPDMLANTRTTLTNAAMRRLCWNMNFHAEHHAYPSVPFHALPELHLLLRDRLQITAPGYIAANREILRHITAGASRPARPAPRPPRAAS
ncbi:MAG: fatty acid desaturase [Kiloniellales bacterium]